MPLSRLCINFILRKTTQQRFFSAGKSGVYFDMLLGLVAAHAILDDHNGSRRSFFVYGYRPGAIFHCACEEPRKLALA